MAAQDFPSPSRSGYLALYYALNELRTKTLKNHISNGRFYNQPLTSMVRDMHLLLQSKEPNRKFPQTIRKEDVPEYFERLLNEVNSATKHDFYGKIELGIRQNKWTDLPPPLGEAVPATPSTTAETTNTPAEDKKQEIVENLAKDKAETTKRFRAGSAPKTKKPEQPAKEEKPSEQTVQPVQKLSRWQTLRSFFSQKKSQPTPASLYANQIKPVRIPITARLNQGRRIATTALSNPLKGFGSQIAVQIIRHPLIKNRLLTAGLGAAGGGFVGGWPGAGVGALLGGLFGPNVGSQIGNYLTQGRSQMPVPSGGGSEGGSSRNSSASQNLNRARQAALQARRLAAAGRLAVGFFARNPWVWAVIGGIILLFILSFLIVGCVLPMSNCEKTGKDSTTSQITIQKTAPSEVENGASIEFKILVTNKGSGTANIIITDDIPVDTIYKSGDNDPVTEGETVKKIQWDIKNLPAGQSKTLSFQVEPQKNDFWIVNQAKGTAQFANSGGNVSIPGNIPPTADNCNGAYPLKNPIGNFGDPKCDFKKDDLYQMLKQLDPSNADIWFLEVARCESNYSPNAYADPIAVGTPDSAGAWGLFQMGRGKNGDLDHGDVIWQLQASNAVNYSIKIPNKWGYWQCANHRW